MTRDPEVAIRLSGGVIGVRIAIESLQIWRGDGEQQLQRLLELGITGKDFCSFYREKCRNNLTLIHNLVEFQTLVPAVQQWAGTHAEPGANGRATLPAN